MNQKNLMEVMVVVGAIPPVLEAVVLEVGLELLPRAGYTVEDHRETFLEAALEELALHWEAGALMELVEPSVELEEELAAGQEELVQV